MSEAQTTPAAAPAAAPASPAPVSSGGTGDNGASAGSAVAESPTPSGSETESTTTEAIQEVAQDEAPAIESDSSSSSPSEESSEETPQIPALSGFDPSGWNGNIDGLPAELQDPVRFLHRHLEGGFTKKFQDLSDQRKLFDSDRETFDRARGTWDLQKAEVEQERDLFRQIIEGTEDPRLSEFSKVNDGLKEKVKGLQSEYDDYRKLVEADIQEQARITAERFREVHSDVFEDDEKRNVLIKLVEDDWDPEVAVRLLGHDEKTFELAKTLRDQGTPQKVAVEHAMLKAGGIAATRKPRPGARLTAGAESRNNPESVRETVKDARNPGDRRLIAAREALEWGKRSKTR